MSLSKPFARFAFACAMTVIAGPALAQSVNLSGDWTGGYVGDSGNDANRFDVKLRQSGPQISGTMVELNAIGDTEQVLFLTSNFAGRVAGDMVSFTKTYDGSGGVDHSVVYQGRLDETGRRIRGTYSAEGATGAFEMVR